MPDLKTELTTLSTQAYALARAMAEHRGVQAELQAQADALDDRLKALGPLPVELAAEFQALLSETDLDISYVLAGGSGPMSLRLGRHLRDG